MLGADDGIVSVASLAMGVIASGASRNAVLAAAIAALVAGAMSMAAGEYVSVSSQRDTELGDLDQEQGELADDPKRETQELAAIYRRRGHTAGLASQVADALMANDALEAHARDELGLSPNTRAHPLQAALFSAASFTMGGALAPRTTGCRTRLNPFRRSDRNGDSRPRRPRSRRRESRRRLTAAGSHTSRIRRYPRDCSNGRRWSPLRSKHRLTRRRCRLHPSPAELSTICSLRALGLHACSSAEDH